MKLTALDQRLEGRLKELYKSHLELTAKIDWSYHTLIPWERGRNFISDPWAPDQVMISPELYVAVETALLTEVNLPWFTTGLTNIFRGSSEVIHDFIRTWTAEEDQHADALQVYLLVTRNADPDRLHRLRKVVVERAWTPGDATPFVGMCYTAIQELATQSYYIKVAQKADTEDPVLATLLRRLAKDETLHYVFYREAVKAHLELNPNYIEELVPVMTSFSMPGAMMPNFKQRIDVVAQHSNYGIAEYYSNVIDVLMNLWDVKRLQPTAPGAIEALKRLNKHVDLLARLSVAAKKHRITSAEALAKRRAITSAYDYDF